MILSKVINFSIIKIFFTNNLVIFFYLEPRYLDCLVFVSLSVNVSNMLPCSENFLSFLQLYLISNTKDTKITKKNTILAYFKCFLDNLRLSLLNDKDAKNIDKGT